MNPHQIVAKPEWIEARRALLAKEKELTRLRDRLAEEQRALLEVVEIGNLTIGILPVNSALFCQGDDDHAKLWIGRRCLDTAVEELTKLGSALKIALIHHPLDWLHEAKRSNVRTALQSNVDIILRGHLHETDVEAVAGVMGDALHMAAGAAYQTRRWPNRALYTTFENGKVEVFPIRYEDQPREIWTTDPSVFPEPPHSKIFTISRTAMPSPSLSAIRVGENIAAVSRIGIAPSAKNQIGPETIIKWRFPLGNELSVTAMTNTAKIVYIEYDCGGDSRGSLSDFPGFQFGTTTLAEIREKFGSNAFTFDKNPTGPFPDGLLFSNNYEIADTNVIAIFWYKDYPKLAGNLLATANHAKLVSIILADATYLPSTWGKITADPKYQPIHWK